jgi:hypothetical protein
MYPVVTVATAGLLLVQEPLMDVLSIIKEVTQTLDGPEITGRGAIVNVALALHPATV